MDLNNAATIEFVDISSEAWREYQFPGGEKIRIEAPLKLNVSDSGGHRILDAAGLSHYIAPKWYGLTWQSKDGQPHFVV